MPMKPPVHKPQGSGPRPDVRPSFSKRGYNAAWQRARAAQLAAYPLCADCLKEQPPRLTPATICDHIVPHKGDMEVFWQDGNLQSLCAHHHSVKTMREGAFGRAIKPSNEAGNDRQEG